MSRHLTIRASASKVYLWIRSCVLTLAMFGIDTQTVPVNCKLKLAAERWLIRYSARKNEGSLIGGPSVKKNSRASEDWMLLR